MSREFLVNLDYKKTADDCNRLGVSYSKGQGVEQGYQQGVNW